jgi:hypothetical protein
MNTLTNIEAQISHETGRLGRNLSYKELGRLMLRILPITRFYVLNPPPEKYRAQRGKR